MTLSADDLDRLERLAKAATSGPWSAQSYPVIDTFVLSDVDDDGYVCRAILPADGNYIATASPDVTLALVAEIREWRRERGERDCYGRAFDVFNRWRQTVTGQQPGFSHQDGVRFERMLQEAFAPAPATEPEQ